MRLKTARPQARTNADWYRISNLADGAAEVVIYDEIGWFGVSAGAFLEELKAVTASEITLRLNSPGGDVFDGIAIMNVLRSHPAKVTTYVDGLAASIASVIAMAGDRIVMQPHSQLMIHNAWGMCIGDTADMTEMANQLARHSDNIAGVYAERAGGTVAEWRERMAAETWFTPEEAVAAGLADEVGKHDHPEQEPAASNAWDLSVFRYAGRPAAPPPLATAVGPHETATKEGAWDGPAEEKKLPSPVPVTIAKAMYGWYDGDQVEDGSVPKSACKLPHHVVDADGKPGAASLNGVRNALARLPQTDGLTDTERSTIERHLRDHLPDEENHANPGVVAVAASQTPPAEPAAGPQETQEEDSMSTLSEGLRERLGITDAELDDDALLAALDDQLAAVTEPTEPTIETPAEPVAAKLPEGTVAIDEATLAELREQAAEGVAARAQQRVEARDRALDDAVNAGKFPPARREHWARLYDLDPEGTRQTLASLADGVIPLQDVGEPGGEPDNSASDAEFDHLFSRKVG